MVNFPKVSILIPVYNRARLVIETLNSAVNQTYKNIEVVVVDNKSTDNTFEILKKFAKLHLKVKVYQNEENIAIVRNWKKCLDYATGEYVKILWSDDLIAPTFIEKTLPYLMEHNDVGFVFTGTEIFNDDTGKKEKAYLIGDTGIYSTEKFIEESLLEDPFAVPVSPGNALFAKKDLEKNLLIYIPNKIGIDFSMLGSGNDVLIYLLTGKAYPKFAFIDETLSFFRDHKDSITISRDRIEIATFYHLAKAYFVENFITDDKLRRKFNAKLLILLVLSFVLRLKGRKNMKIKKIQGFYFSMGKGDIAYLFLPQLILKMLFYVLKRLLLFS